MLSAISQNLYNVAVSLNLVDPTQEFFPEFKPIIDINLGHIGTNYCQKIAENLRRDIKEIASQIIPKLDTSFGVWKEDQGFLNLYLNQQSLIEFAKCKVEPRIDAEKFKITFLSTRCNLTNLRLVALALMQARFLVGQGAEVVLNFLGQDLKISSSESLSPEKMKDLILKVISSETETTLEDIQKLIFNDSTREFFWLAPQALPKKDFTELVNQYFSGSLERILLCPPRAQVLGFSDALPKLANYSAEEILNLCWYLCLPRIASEVDFNVAKLTERENLRAFIPEILDRLTKLEVQGVQYLSLSNNLKDRELFCARFYLINLFKSGAAFRGDLQLFFEALHDLVICLVRLINQHKLSPNLGEKPEKSRAFEIEALKGLLSDLAFC